MTNFLDVQHLSKSYAVATSGVIFKKDVSLAAVRDVSFSLGKGETLGVVGESGCGKSTVGRLLLGMLAPSSGQILLEGEPVSSKRDAAWRSQRLRMQMIYQDPLSYLDRRIPVGRQVIEPLDIHFSEMTKAEKESKAKELFSTVGLRHDLFDHYPHELSGGQRQRVVIARALILNPELIVCDEPISALDVSVGAQVINLMKEIQAERKLTYVFISHDLKSVRQISTHVAVMYLGQIVEYGRPDDVFHNPLHPYTQALVASVPSIEKRMAALPPLLSGDLPSPMNLPSGCSFHPRCSFATDRCRIESPQKIHQTTGRMVTCHLVKAVGDKTE